MAAITGIGTGIFCYFESRYLLEQQFKKSLLNSAEIIQNSICEKIEAAEKVILRAAKKEVFSGKDFLKVQDRLESLVEAGNFFHNIYFFDKSGVLRAAAYADGRDMTKYLGLNFDEYKKDPARKSIYLNLKRAFAAANPVFSDPFLSNRGRVMYSYIVPVLQSGKVQALISCGIQLCNENAPIINLLHALRPNKESFIALIGKQSQILAKSGNSVNLTKTFSAENKVSYFKKDGFIQVTNTIKNTGIRLWLGIPEKIIKTHLKKLSAQIFFYSFFIVIASCAIGYWIAAKLISPVTELVTGLKELGNGNLNYSFMSKGKGEVGEAIEAYKGLQDKIKKDIMVDKVWTDLWND
jgi:hypothetical protein